MKPLSTTLLALSLLIACSKNKRISSKGQVIEIANWRYDKTAVPVAGVKVCMSTYSSSSSFSFGLNGNKNTVGQTTCAITDADGKFDLSMSVNRKDYRHQSYSTYVPAQSYFIVEETDMSDARNTSAITDARNILTIGAYKGYPVVVTLNNVNYLNDRDSLILQGGLKDILFMGKQTNTKNRNLFGTKRSQKPTAVGGGFGYQIFRNGISIEDVGIDNNTQLIGDTAYYTINY